MSNELLDYYKSKGGTKDLLNRKKHPEINYKSTGFFEDIGIMSTPKGIYYVKTASKRERDAEILLSRIYEKAGLSTAIYTPVGKRGFYTGVASNDVVNGDNNIIRAKEYIREYGFKIAKDIEDPEAKHIIIRKPFYMPKRFEDAHANYDEFITKEGMRSLLLKRIFDSASYNIDGHYRNYFYATTDGKKVTDTISIDHSLSGNAYRSDPLIYYNEFHEDKLRISDLLYKYTDSEIAQSYLPTIECAETIGSINVIRTAKEIEKEEGYSINQKYVDAIANRYAMAANCLMLTV